MIEIDPDEIEWSAIRAQGAIGTSTGKSPEGSSSKKDDS